ncbi:MAG: hypothetical protein JSW34_13390 [Candidatus Zixiibacteriota bacterium]|nr:MAG: hypothetical protein JSW34_13390 [candidate division Zixibacteria bacterium]
MFLDKYGVNIVKGTFNRAGFVVLTALLGLLACSQKEEQAKVETSEEVTAAAETQPVTFEDSIEVLLSEAIDRLGYADKSFIYEMEFEYFKKQTTFDDYLKRRDIMFARKDSLTRLEVVNADRYEQDSAKVDLNVYFEGRTGVQHVLKDSVTVYYHQGRWIKPTASKIDDQLKYERGETP